MRSRSVPTSPRNSLMSCRTARAEMRIAEIAWGYVVAMVGSLSHGVTHLRVRNLRFLQALQSFGDSSLHESFSRLVNLLRSFGDLL